MNRIPLYSVFTLFVFTAAQPIYSQDKKQQRIDEVNQWVEGQNYSFRAQSALPLRGRSRQLTSDYRLRISKDTIECDLPYFGRAQTAPTNPAEGGIHFISTDFEYTKKNAKKDGWDIIIKFKDVREPRQMSLRISSSGYATLQVPGSNRDPISFNGEIVEVKSK